MIIGRIAGATRVFGQRQGYLGLPLRDEPIQCNVAGDTVPSMLTAWEPTPHEIELINRGAPVLLRLLGEQHPPVSITVGEPPKMTGG